jgi:hypothetical protein
MNVQRVMFMLRFRFSSTHPLTHAQTCATATFVLHYFRLCRLSFPVILGEAVVKA